jgi:iron(III) transport system permease protein
MAALTSRASAAVGTGSLGPALYVSLLAVVSFLVLCPAFEIIDTSFHVGALGHHTAFGLGNWRQALTDRHLLDVMWNTITLSVTRQSISMIVGVAMAWLIARTNLPGRGLIEFFCWIAMFMPALPVALAWVLLAGGPTGVLNLWIATIFPSLHQPVFNVYSWWGIVWLHLVSGTIPVKVFLLAPAFRYIDSSLEESARTCGANWLRSMRTILLPVLTPVLLAVLLIGLIRAMQSFEVELVVGTPAGIDVVSTMIYRQMRQEPPLYGSASVLSIGFIAMILPFVFLQQRFGSRNTHATLGGKFSSRLINLGNWRWPLCALLLLLVAIMTVVPAGMLIMGSCMKLFGEFDLPQPWSLVHWVETLSRPDLLLSLMNTFELGFGAALGGMVLFSLVAYAIVRFPYRSRGVMDFLTWVPSIVPGIVTSLAYLMTFVKTPFLRPLYGTIWVLVIAVVISSMTIGVQMVKGSMAQLSRELEEASWTTGASRVRTFLTIVVPLAAPSIIAVGLQTFGTAVSVVSIVALLGTSDTQPLSILQLGYLDAGQFESATIVGTLIVLVAVLASALARLITRRYTLIKG